VALENGMLIYFEIEPNMVFPAHSHEAEQIILVRKREPTFAMR
jgi:quercetin dioxygenase-like cupin family protein